MNKTRARKIENLKAILVNALWRLKEARDDVENPDFRDGLREFMYSNVRDGIDNLLKELPKISPYFPRNYLSRAKEIMNQITQHPNDKYYRPINSSPLRWRVA